MDRAVAERVFPGAVLAVAHRGVLGHLAPFGAFHYGAGAPPVRPDTIYDLASLTKLIVTTSLAMRLVEDGRLDLDAPVAHTLPEFDGPGKVAVTARHLLAHCSGLPGFAPLFLEAQGRELVTRA